MAALLPEIRIGGSDVDQVPLELASDGVLRYIWHGKFGQMLIEVRAGVAYVDGKRVTSAAELKSLEIEDAVGGASA
jgi:hypothetical protein